MSFSRRDFLKSSAVAVAAMSANQAFALEKKGKNHTARFKFRSVLCGRG